MRIATWNVNSARQRLPRLLDWLQQRQPDVVCLQETKLTDDVFSDLFTEPLAALGYRFAHHGSGGFNGVALLSRVGLDDVERNFAGQPAYRDAGRLFSYWDYRAGMFHQDLGMRIDLVLASQQVANRVAAAWVDRAARKGKLPSDHAPVIMDLDEAPDGDIGPVVPPASNPRRIGSTKLPQSRTQ